ncbi:MAG: beta-eliminating lyase-related protein [Celeribacter marinus]
MFFASDNTSAAHPKVMEALMLANDGYTPAYGADPFTDILTERVRELFNAPDALVYPMTSGTATNAALLAAMSPPWGVIYCHETAHIEVDERGAATFYAGGAKLRALPSLDSRLNAQTLSRAIANDRAGHDIHAMPPAAVSLTNLTEYGEAYTPAHIETLVDCARLPLHMDGARFANAIASTGATPWEMTREMTTLSLGGTKNGAMTAELAILFDPDLKHAFESHRMRGGHNVSKARFISAQMLAWLEDDLWLDLATHANAMATRLADGLEERGAEMDYTVDGNMVFARLPLDLHRQAWAAGAVYHPWEDVTGLSPDTPVLARLVTSWSTTEDDVDALLAALD